MMWPAPSEVEDADCYFWLLSGGSSMEFQLQRKKYKSPKFWTSDFCELCSFRNKMFEEAHILVPPVYQYIYSGEKKKKKNSDNKQLFAYVFLLDWWDTLPWKAVWIGDCRCALYTLHFMNCIRRGLFRIREVTFFIPWCSSQFDSQLVEIPDLALGLLFQESKHGTGDLHWLSYSFHFY